MNVLSAPVAFASPGITPLGWSAVLELHRAAMAAGVFATVS
jgi:hypothetical protein